MWGGGSIGQRRLSGRAGLARGKRMVAERHAEKGSGIEATEAGRDGAGELVEGNIEDGESSGVEVGELSLELV